MKRYFKKWYHEDTINRRNYISMLDIVKMNLDNNKYDFDPFYQRDYVWSQEQKKSYIENLFVGKANIELHLIQLPFGSSDFYYEILDGKQRLSTIKDFLQDKIKIFDNVKYSELHKSDKKNFNLLRVNVTEYSSLEDKIDDKTKIELFLEINELGTKMSEEHLEKIRKIKIEFE